MNILQSCEIADYILTETTFNRILLKSVWKPAYCCSGDCELHYTVLLKCRVKNFRNLNRNCYVYRHRCKQAFHYVCICTVGYIGILYYIPAFISDNEIL